MSLFKRTENRDAALGNLVDLLALREGGLTNQTGEKVNEMSALGISTVYSAISLIADSIALLPIKQSDTIMKKLFLLTSQSF